MVTITHVNKHFGDLQVLRNISLSFEYGKVYGLMGENGAGKSTLFRCIVGLEHYKGVIDLDNRERHLGYLPDIPYYYTYVTGYEYIEFCLSARGMKITRDAIDRANEHFRLPLRKFATRYSLGMKKRLALLALILQDHDILVLDEPFNGMDLAGCILLKQWIRNLRKQGKLIIVSSHIISSLTDICDEIYYMHEGEVVQHYKGQSADSIEQDISKHYLCL